MPLRLLLLFLLWLYGGQAAFGFSEGTWSERKGSHFVVYEQERSAFSDDVLRKAEDIYQEIIRYFGSLPEISFWSWDNRCKIYIYRSKSEYMAKTRQPDWSSGFAEVNQRVIVSFQNAPDFLESVLPHETAHLIFREFIGTGNHRVPRWLDEGFAIAQEERMRVILDESVHRAVATDTAISLQNLTEISSLNARPTDQARLFYGQAQSLVRFLLEGRDPSYFINFCRLLRDGTSLEEALRRSYDRDFSTLSDFEKRWKKHVLQS